MKTLLLVVVSFASLITCFPLMAEGVDYSPTVVEISTYKAADSDKVVTRSMGFVLEEDGFILSVYQGLLDPASEEILTRVDVYIPELDKSYPAEIVGVEPTLDLSILKIFSEEELKVGRLKTYDETEEGIEVSAPILASSVDNDSPLQQVFGVLRVKAERECYQFNMTATMHQAHIDITEPLMVGAPILNPKGEVVAVYTGYKPTDANDIYVWDQNITYILPAYLATNIYDSLKHKKNMRSPWTGFAVRRLTEEESEIFPTAAGDQGGIAIEDVWKNSPAEALGVQVNDILVRFGHYRIESPADFQKWLYMYGEGMTIDMSFIRGKETIVLEYTIEERPEWAVPK